MTTSIDSSFTSQSDDFANLNDSEMSESLIYCLNGNEPSTPRAACASASSNSYNSNTNVCIKRPHAPTTSIEDLCDRNSAHVSDMLYVDYGCIHPKKNHLELDETAL